MRTLEEINQEIAAHHGCGFELCAGATNPVPGEGNPQADVMFVGEGPGKNEDLQGQPFVGAAGKLLDELLAGIGMQRNDVFIGNVIKHRPPNNRDPKPEEIAHQWPWLRDQVEAIQPKLIVLLGRHAMDTFLPDCAISQDHGRGKRFRSQVFYPVYHPAAALYNGSLRSVLADDFAKIPGLLQKIGAGEQPDRLPLEPALPAARAAMKLDELAHGAHQTNSNKTNQLETAQDALSNQTNYSNERLLTKGE